MIECLLLLCLKYFFLMRPSMCSSLLVDIFTDSSVIFLDLILHCITEPIIINIYNILYVYWNFSTSCFLPLKHICCFSTYSEPSQITLILSTQLNIFLDFFFSSLMKMLSKTSGITKPKELTKLFPSFIILALYYENIMLEPYKIIFFLALKLLVRHSFLI